jgi:hypothetical protein
MAMMTTAASRVRACLTTITEAGDGATWGYPMFHTVPEFVEYFFEVLSDELPDEGDRLVALLPMALQQCERGGAFSHHRYFTDAQKLAADVLDYIADELDDQDRNKETTMTEDQKTPISGETIYRAVRVHVKDLADRIPAETWTLVAQDLKDLRTEDSSPESSKLDTIENAKRIAGLAVLTSIAALANQPSTDVEALARALKDTLQGLSSRPVTAELLSTATFAEPLRPFDDQLGHLSAFYEGVKHILQMRPTPNTEPMSTASERQSMLEQIGHLRARSYELTEIEAIEVEDLRLPSPGFTAESVKWLVAELIRIRSSLTRVQPPTGHSVGQGVDWVVIRLQEASRKLADQKVLHTPQRDVEIARLNAIITDVDARLAEQLFKATKAQTIRVLDSDRKEASSVTPEGSPQFEAHTNRLASIRHLGWMAWHLAGVREELDLAVVPWANRERNRVTGVFDELSKARTRIGELSMQLSVFNESLMKAQTRSDAADARLKAIGDSLSPGNAMASSADPIVKGIRSLWSTIKQYEDRHDASIRALDAANMSVDGSLAQSILALGKDRDESLACLKRERNIAELLGKLLDDVDAALADAGVRHRDLEPGIRDIVEREFAFAKPVIRAKHTARRSMIQSLVVMRQDLAKDYNEAMTVALNSGDTAIHTLQKLGWLHGEIGGTKVLTSPPKRSASEKVALAPSTVFGTATHDAKANEPIGPGLRAEEVRGQSTRIVTACPPVPFTTDGARDNRINKANDLVPPGLRADAKRLARQAGLIVQDPTDPNDATALVFVRGRVMASPPVPFTINMQRLTGVVLEDESKPFDSTPAATARRVVDDLALQLHQAGAPILPLAKMLELMLHAYRALHGDRDRRSPDFEASGAEKAEHFIASRNDERVRASHVTNEPSIRDAGINMNIAPKSVF